MAADGRPPRGVERCAAHRSGRVRGDRGERGGSDAARVLPAGAIGEQSRSHDRAARRVAAAPFGGRANHIVVYIKMCFTHYVPSPARERSDRQRILELIWEDELSAGDIARSLPVTFGAVSNILGSCVRPARSASVARAIEVLPGRRDALGPVGEMLHAMWGTHLKRLKTLAELEQHRPDLKPTARLRRRPRRQWRLKLAGRVTALRRANDWHVHPGLTSRPGASSSNADELDLRRDGQSVRLQRQPGGALALLVERAGQVVTRIEHGRAVC